MSTIGCGARRVVWPWAHRHAARLARKIEAALMPPVCCLCGASGQAPDLDLCDVCATLLPVIGPSAESGGTLVRTLFLFKYEYPVDHFIRALKFRGERVFARVLGQLMARAHCDSGWSKPACIVPMPLHPTRFRERGFNQACEIARYAAASLRVPVCADALIRTVPTREQSGLSLAERHCNVLDAFRVVRPIPRMLAHAVDAGRHIALLDDVVTTGSTAMAAAKALTGAGAGEIELWAVARVEKDSQGATSRSAQTAAARGRQ
jgi:ComF family protein